MLERLNLDFSFYDWLLVIIVTIFGTISAYIKDPQLKAVTGTVPIPFGFAYIAIGHPIGAANAGGALLCLLFVHVVRILTYKMHVPIVLSILAGIIAFIVPSAILLPIMPQGECFFFLICAVNLILGIFLFKTQTYHKGIQYKTPLPVYIKAPAVAAVVAGLMLIKKIVGGFATSFPMMNSIVSYESRHSLGDQCRQLPLFLIAAPFMFVWMHYSETRFSWNHWFVLVTGVTLYMIIFIPLNQKLRKKIEAAAKEL
ncbi:MAG: hypothetical protein WCR04_05015 [Fibrobacteraceae bacterium]